MELRSYLAIIWRRKWVVLVTAIVTVLFIYLGMKIIPPMYEAETTLRVAPAGSNYTDYTYANQLKITIISIASSDMVSDSVMQRLNLDEPPKIEVESLGASQLILLTAQHPDPYVAQQSANTAAEILTDLHDELYVKAETSAREVLSEQLTQAERELNEARIEFERISAESPNDEGLIQGAAGDLDMKQQVFSNLWERNSDAMIRENLQANAFSVLETAALPEEPAGLSNELYIALGAFLGIAAGIGLTFLFENLDSKLYTTGQIESVSRTVTLGSIPTAGKGFPLLGVGRKSLKEYQEAFRRLRTNLFARHRSSSLQALLITSAEPREGKSTISANLAQTIAESGKQVVVVDCDLHRPTLHTIFNFTNEVGLSNILLNQVSLDAALNPTETSGLFQICAGPHTPKTAELLGSQAMVDLMHELRQRFEIIVLDTPAIEAIADAAILAPYVDGVLLIVRRGKVREGAVWSACKQLANVGVRPIGVVVNRAKQGSTYNYYTDYKRISTVSEGDSLTQIEGIGISFERMLKDKGISTFSQLGEQNVEDLIEILGGDVNEKRIEEWIEQARELAFQVVRG